MNNIQTKIATGKFAMLAQKNGDRPLEFDPPKKYYFLQPKLDGIRCIISKDGAFSRNGKEFKNVKHILNELKPLFKYAPELVLDGELYTHKYKDNFNKIISLMRKQTPSQADRFNAVDVQYHCYDIVDERRPELSYRERHDMIQHLQYKYNLLYTRPVATYVVDNQMEINKIHNTNKEQGYEGSMVRSNAPYEHKRSWTLQKVKDWSDTEITITGFVEGKGKFANGLGKFIGLDSTGRIVEVPWPNLTIKDRQAVWATRKSFLGKELTFEYFERTPAGAYRFPRAKTLRNYE